MNKGSHFNGQPAYGQLINLLDKSKILQISQERAANGMSNTLTPGSIC